VRDGFVPLHDRRQQHWLATKMLDALRERLTDLGVSTARPAAFIVWAAFVVLWVLFDGESFGWHAVATMATWLMTLFIQRAEHRDTQAIHAKLDELLRAHDKARNELIDLDQEEPEEIERQRSRGAGPD
jgi:low affinity Fe/Cu permease